MKKRLDQLLIERGLVETRTKAQGLIMAGLVLVGDKIIDKAGQQIDEKADIELKEKFPYVSRGALKLEKAYEEFGLDFNDKVICDIGSSTGGFTDFSLQHGAKIVYAIDVGRGQIDQKLRNDPRVVVMEKTDFREVTELTKKVDFFVCDVSFISLKKIIPKISELASRCHPDRVKRVEGSLDKLRDDNSVDSQAILLIKPQFEVGKKEADRGKGVITDPELHEKVINEIQDTAIENGFRVKGVIPSPITGAKGNKEFLIWLRLR